MRGNFECMTCRQHLHSGEFYTLRPRSGRRECKVCFHLRMERRHGREAARLQRRRRAEEARYAMRVDAARAVLGE